MHMQKQRRSYTERFTPWMLTISRDLMLTGPRGMHVLVEPISACVRGSTNDTNDIPISFKVSTNGTNDTIGKDRW